MSRLLLWGVGLCFAAACTCAVPPQAHYACDSDADCPSGEVCVADNCTAPDAGQTDSGVHDAGVPDGGAADAGPFVDAGAPDAGFSDAGPSSDAGVADAGPCYVDAGTNGCAIDVSGAYSDFQCVSAALTAAATRSSCLFGSAQAMAHVRQVPLPTAAPGSGDRFGGAVLTPYGLIGIPNKEHDILRVAFDGGVSLCAQNLPFDAGWVGGALGKDGFVYAMPFTAMTVLRIDPSTCATQIFDAGSNGYSGAVLDLNGRVWGMPDLSSSVLEFDPNGALINTFTAQTTSVEAVTLSADGLVFAFKRSATGKSGRLDPAAPATGFLTFALPSSTATVVTAVTLADGGIWALPATTSDVTLVDPSNLMTSEFALGGIPDHTFGRGALRGDGHIIALPDLDEHLLDLDTATESWTTYDDPGLDGGPTVKLTRWISLTALPDGTLVAVPSNADVVLIIELNRPGTLDIHAALSAWLNRP